MIIQIYKYIISTRNVCILLIVNSNIKNRILSSVYKNRTNIPLLYQIFNVRIPLIIFMNQRFVEKLMTTYSAFLETIL